MTALVNMSRDSLSFIEHIHSGIVYPSKNMSRDSLCSKEHVQRDVEINDYCDSNSEDMIFVNLHSAVSLHRHKLS